MRGQGVFAVALLSASFAVGQTVNGTWVDPSVLDACPGYDASNVTLEADTLTADLQLAGEACNVFGQDIEGLTLQVVFETETRIHLKITDAGDSTRYEVPEEVFPRPQSQGGVSPESAAIQFNYTESPFSFSIFRTTTGEVLFTTAGRPLIFEPQYWRVKTALPTSDAHIYGLGEHTDPFRLLPYNTTRTLWSRDAYGVPEETNLYGNHPVYFEHRPTGSHGVFLLNSNGMDVKINNTENADETTLEYNVIGGVIDFYFLAGSEDDPTELARQYAEVAGRPAEVPYWSFGLHQCRFGYTDFVDVSRVIVNYSAAGIPLETMWTDIDYMDRRRVFTVDPEYFPMNRMREIVDYLHDHDQQYIVMTDPAVAYTPDDEGYAAYHRGVETDVWLKLPNGSYSIGLVWPGVTVYPDWFHPNIQEYWDTEFDIFYGPDTGLDIDGVWIDMNEPANFCNLPCTDPFQQAIEQALPPSRLTSPPDPNTPIFVNASNPSKTKRQEFPAPQYSIHNAAPSGDLSSKTAFVNSTHANGLVEYDTHNLYGTMMSSATRESLLHRRPGLKPLVITRSTFAGAGAHVGKWLGDNLSTWQHYRNSISGILGFATVFQMPMVGADICGFGGNTTETLCARWATLGAFYPFMRDHNGDTSISQEFYRWETVTNAAKNAIDIRYRLLDYIYTAFHQAHLDGTPVLQPLWMHYPKDPQTYGIDLQFFYGDSILVNPVTEENTTSVTYYLSEGLFYDFKTHEPVQGAGANVTVDDVDYTEIPLLIKGGSIVPLRTESAMTTEELRKKPFEIVIAPDANGYAFGQLYIDDGVSLEPSIWIFVQLTYENGTFTLDGEFGYTAEAGIRKVTLLGVTKEPGSVSVNSADAEFSFDNATGSVEVVVDVPLTERSVITLL